METRDTEKALRWIVEILKKHDVPFQIIGGLAARLYGSPRQLVDIDIGIPGHKFGDIYPDVKEYLIYGPAHYIDRKWNLQLMTLRYAGQEIDVPAEDTLKFFNEITHSWEAERCDFSKYEMKEIYGMSVPIIPKDALIDYKKKIAREVDREDVEALASGAMGRGV